MPVILAVEPDRRQAAQLASLTHAHLNAELVIAESAARALDTIADCIPDVILTSAFLSPKDDAALADRLRDLGAAASHVQTLTIPIFAGDRPAVRRGGLLSALGRKTKSRKAMAEGCEPATFAEQIGVYLDRAAREREQAPILDTPPAEAVEILPVCATPDAATEPIEAQPLPSAVFVMDPGMVSEIECELEVDLSVGLDEIAGGELDEADGDQEVWTIDRRTIEASGKAADGPTAPTPMEQSASEPVNLACPVHPPIAKNKGRKKQRPVQDEWGFFDPEQCGFPALLAKLDEIARSEESEA